MTLRIKGLETWKSEVKLSPPRGRSLKNSMTTWARNPAQIVQKSLLGRTFLVWVDLGGGFSSSETAEVRANLVHSVTRGCEKVREGNTPKSETSRNEWGALGPHHLGEERQLGCEGWIRRENGGEP